MNILASDEHAIVRLLRGEAPDVQVFAAGLPETRRAHLALFCFARPRLRALGLLLARECSGPVLKAVGGYAGEFLADQALADTPIGPAPFYGEGNRASP